MNWISQQKYTRYFFLLFILFLLVRMQDGLFLSQLGDLPINAPRIDPFIWFMHAIGLPQFIIQSGISIVLDSAIVVLPMVILFYSFSKKWLPRKLILFHAILFFFYVAFVYCFPTLSLRKYLGLVLIPFAFTFDKESRYIAYLKLMRFYAIFIFVSASIWKIARGHVWDSSHMHHILKAQHIDNIVHAPSHISSSLASFFIGHPAWSTILIWSAVMSQLIFGIGFFTRKYDRWLGILLIVFVAMDYLIMRIEYWEFLVFLPLFYMPKSNTDVASS